MTPTGAERLARRLAATGLGKIAGADRGGDGDSGGLAAAAALRRLGQVLLGSAPV